MAKGIFTFHYQYCENGHMIYSNSGQVKNQFCKICGAPFILKCSKCKKTISSSFNSPVFFTTGEPVNCPQRPGACSNCGTIFPWSNPDGTLKEISDLEAISTIIIICKRFHKVVKEIRKRRENRQTLDIEDEYDVQDLLRALLTVYFDDIRSEEWTPSYAGGSARVDFLIKNHMILIETKKTRPGISDKDIGDQLIEDIARYKKMGGIKALICFIYDPEERLSNPIGLSSDLETLDKDIGIKVIVSPER